MSAWASAGSRKVMVRLSARLDGMARIFWKSSACSGCRSAAQRIRDRIAVRRRLRVRGAVAPAGFEVVQERADDRSVQVFPA
jgi:hypothetical protein